MCWCWSHISEYWGETVLEALEQGLRDELERNPDLEIFTRDRYEECRNFITNFKPSKEKKINFNSNATKYKSRFIKDDTKSQQEETPDIDFSEIDIQTIVTKYSTKNEADPLPPQKSFDKNSTKKSTLAGLTCPKLVLVSNFFVVNNM